MSDILTYFLSFLFYYYFDENNFFYYDIWYQNDYFHQEPNSHLKHFLITICIFTKICEFCLCNYFFI